MKFYDWLESRLPHVNKVGDEFTMHVSFEYRGKEYNYGAATPEGFKVLFKIGLKPL